MPARAHGAENCPEPGSQPVLLPYHTHTATSASAESTAGTMPAIDSMRIDTPAVKA